MNSFESMYNDGFTEYTAEMISPTTSGSVSVSSFLISLSFALPFVLYVVAKSCQILISLNLDLFILYAMVCFYANAVSFIC